MRTALIDADQVQAPTVGRWHPDVREGSAVTAGCRLGTLRRAGETVVVAAPKAASGVALNLLPAGSWVECGTVLMAVGDALGAVGVVKEAAASDAPDGVTVVHADTDGTVYLRPEPGKPEFAPVGSSVAARGTLALVEVMKTFSPVRAPIEGIVDRVLVDDGQTVSEGADLFWIRAPSV